MSSHEVVPQQFRKILFQNSEFSEPVELRPGTRFSIYVHPLFDGNRLNFYGQLPGTDTWFPLSTEGTLTRLDVTPDAIFPLPDAVAKSGVSLIKFLSNSPENGTSYLFLA